MPGRVVVELSPGQSTAADIMLGKGIPVLETREITAQWTSEIQRRVQVSTSGHFVKPEEIASRGRNTPLPALLYQVPSVKVDCIRPSQCRVAMRAFGSANQAPKAVDPRSGGYCTPSLYVDGVRDRLLDFNVFYSGDIFAIEVYRQLGRPFEFLDENPCGAIAVWTKPIEGRKKKG
jgi:hypothetical protein